MNGFILLDCVIPIYLSPQLSFETASLTNNKNLVLLHFMAKSSTTREKQLSRVVCSCWQVLFFWWYPWDTSRL